MQNITFTDGETKRFVGASVYNALGKRLGEVTDISLSKAHKLKSVTCSDGTKYTRGQIMALDEIAIIKMPKPITDKTKPAVQRPKQQTSVDSTQPAPNVTAEKTYPIRRRYGDFNFLIGKVVDKNITNFFNEIMLRKGATVTQDVLRQAKISGKLIELCLHAK